MVRRNVSGSSSSPATPSCTWRSRRIVNGSASESRRVGCAPILGAQSFDRERDDLRVVVFQTGRRRRRRSGCVGCRHPLLSHRVVVRDADHPSAIVAAGIVEDMQLPWLEPGDPRLVAKRAPHRIRERLADMEEGARKPPLRRALARRGSSTSAGRTGARGDRQHRRVGRHGRTRVIGEGPARSCRGRSPADFTLNCAMSVSAYSGPKILEGSASNSSASSAPSSSRSSNRKCDSMIAPRPSRCRRSTTRDSPDFRA